MTTILSAAFCNPEGTAAIVETDDAGLVLVSADDSAAWAAMLAAVTPAAFVDALTGVPQSVTRRQGKLALIQRDIYLQFKEIVDAGSPRLQVAFYDSVDWLRDDADLINAARAGGLTDSDLDALFTLAANL